MTVIPFKITDVIGICLFEEALLTLCCSSQLTKENIIVMKMKCERKERTVNMMG